MESKDISIEEKREYCIKQILENPQLILRFFEETGTMLQFPSREH